MDLTGNVRAAQRTIRESNAAVVSATNQLMGNLPYTLNNIDWHQFCSEVDHFKIRTLEVNPPIFGDQILVSETITYRDYSKIFLTSNKILLPFITVDPNLAEIDIYVWGGQSKKNENRKGFILDILVRPTGSELNYGLYSYIPYMEGEKIYGYYVCNAANVDDIMFYNISAISVNTPVPMVMIPTDAFRSTEDHLTEDDIIIASNIGSRFKKYLDESSDITVGRIIKFINRNIQSTVDPKYIRKLMELNSRISLGNNTGIVETESIPVATSEDEPKRHVKPRRVKPKSDVRSSDEDSDTQMEIN